MPQDVTPEVEPQAVPGGLRPLTPDEAALISAHPLPSGVPDALVNQYQLAEALATSQTTLANWRRLGLPFEVEGKNGRSYEFRLSVCFAWMKRREADDVAARLQSEGAAQQLRLALIGGEGAGSDRAGLSIKEQREVYEAEAAYMVAARRRGELIDAAEVAESLQILFAEFRDGLDAAPDRLARELGLDGKAIEAAQVICDDILSAASRRIAERFGTADGLTDHPEGLL